MMGMEPSGYITTKYAYLAFKMIQGNRHDEHNPFSWVQVHLNLPGLKDYDP